MQYLYCIYTGCIKHDIWAAMKFFVMLYQHLTEVTFDLFDKIYFSLERNMLYLCVLS